MAEELEQSYPGVLEDLGLAERELIKQQLRDISEGAEDG